MFYLPNVAWVWGIVMPNDPVRFTQNFVVVRNALQQMMEQTAVPLCRRWAVVFLFEISTMKKDIGNTRGYSKSCQPILRSGEAGWAHRPQFSTTSLKTAGPSIWKKCTAFGRPFYWTSARTRARHLRHIQWCHWKLVILKGGCIVLSNRDQFIRR